MQVGISCTQNGDKKGYTCKIDDPGTLKGKALDRANGAYTRAVNRLMRHPGSSVRVTIGDGKGGSITKSTTQGAIARTLIGANAVYAKGDGGANATYGNGTLTINEPGITRGDRALSTTIIHEGMHGTPMDREFRQEFRDRAWPCKIHSGNSMTRTNEAQAQREKDTLAHQSGYSTMKKNRYFLILSIISCASACQEAGDRYYIYLLSENPNIAYVIDGDSGKYFIGENSWRFSVNDSDFDARIYPKQNSSSISLPQLNFALPLDFNTNDWNISNISCKKLTGNSESYRAKCTTDGRNEAEFGYRNGGVVSFSARCTLSGKTCQYNLRNGIGFSNEIVKGWLAAAPQ